MPRALPEAKDAYEGGEAAILNAESLLEAAKASAEKGNLGVAVGLAVLALEEAVKARALFGFLMARKMGAPFGLSDKAFEDLLYRNHALRHILAFWQGMSNETHTAWISGEMPREEKGRKAVERDLAAARWLSKANLAKLRGFYVDFIDGKWVQPLNVQPADWDMALGVVTPFVEETRRQQGVARSFR